MLAVVLSLAASACWGTADFLAGLASRRHPALVVVAVMQLFGLLLIVLVLVAARPHLPGTMRLLADLGAGASGMVGLLAFYSALASGTMSIVAPLAATGVAVPVVVGLLEGDRLSVVQGIGLVVTVIGIVLASRPGAVPAGRVSAHARSVALALLAAAGFGGYFVFAHSGAKGGVIWLLAVSHLPALPLAIGIGVAGLPLRSLPRPALVRLCGLGLIDLAATTLYALATRRGALAIVAVAGSLYPVVTVSLARVVLRERVQLLQGAGVAAALTGVVLLAAG